MVSKLQMLKWNIYNNKSKKLLIEGIRNGYISTYDDELIEKLRNIYYGCIPASILLLSDGISNGYCYDRALLLSRAFLDEDDDVLLVYAAVNSLRLNPLIVNKSDPLYADHCVVERITKDGKHLIYDTSSGFVFDKKMYWKIEHPKVRKIVSKSSIIDFVNSDNEHNSVDIEQEKELALLILSMIEMTYGRREEMYSHQGIELLQREVDHYKKVLKCVKCKEQ